MKAIIEERRILFFALGLALAMFLMAGCANPVADVLNANEWGLVATWVNSSSISSSPNNSGKLELMADGTFKATSSGGGMSSSGSYTVESVSVDGNTRTYKIHFVWQPGMLSYTLARITDSTKYELNYTTFKPYPSSINTSAIDYFKYTRE